MHTIDTTLTTSGNSVAVRLPKELLKMSGLTSRVTLEARNGKIIISRASTTRDGWDKKIKALVAIDGDPTSEFSDMNMASSDSLDDLPWDGPSFKDWQANREKLS
jgi:antitoxin component of MazEF toxin-antitoxin module